MQESETQPTQPYGITFDQFLGAWLTRGLSDEISRTLLLAVTDLPPWLSASRELKNPQKET